MSQLKKEDIINVIEYLLKCNTRDKDSFEGSNGVNHWVQFLNEVANYISSLCIGENCRKITMTYPNVGMKPGDIYKQGNIKIKVVSYKYKKVFFGLFKKHDGVILEIIQNEK